VLDLGDHPGFIARRINNSDCNARKARITPLSLYIAEKLDWQLNGMF
jgi:hypothetical protein